MLQALPPPVKSAFDVANKSNRLAVFKRPSPQLQPGDQSQNDECRQDKPSAESSMRNLNNPVDQRVMALLKFSLVLESPCNFVNIDFIALLANACQKNAHDDSQQVRISLITNDSVNDSIAAETQTIKSVQLIDQWLAKKLRLARFG
jgi:hypothetical protein